MSAPALKSAMSTPSKASGVASPTTCSEPSTSTLRPADPPDRKQAQLPEREPTLLEHLDHRPPDDAGGADDGDGEGLVVTGAWLLAGSDRDGHGRSIPARVGHSGLEARSGSAEGASCGGSWTGGPGGDGVSERRWVPVRGRHDGRWIARYRRDWQSVGLRCSSAASRTDPPARGAPIERACWWCPIYAGIMRTRGLDTNGSNRRHQIGRSAPSRFAPTVLMAVSVP